MIAVLVVLGVLALVALILFGVLLLLGFLVEWREGVERQQVRLERAISEARLQLSTAAAMQQMGTVAREQLAEDGARSDPHG